ncbi:biopolymer transporter ExbD [Sphingobium sp. AP49]|uniref:ExbD/TolR family protein n=1 Tax=Sphingobium sp. AP49 TaxID=1144307 RepID=UPI00026ECB3B|nr:biopolymer transporter ExbD [Sphingobium sp. AP49]WHO39912.1 biopolymer transporter ExbD [Sphingobium sp. AP49]
MALSFAESRGAQDVVPMGEMNTTPLIDVLLVLLIMFIITIPIQTHSIGVDLPQAQTDTHSPLPDPVKNKVTIDAQGVIRWNGAAVDRFRLRQYLAASMRMPVEPALQFEPDAAARYLIVDAVLADIKRSGVTNLGLVGNERYSRF